MIAGSQLIWSDWHRRLVRRNFAILLDCLLVNFPHVLRRSWCNHCILDNDMNPILAALAAMATATFFSLSTPLHAQPSRNNPAEMERPEVKSFRINGVKSVDKAELKAGLATQASGCKSLAFTPFCAATKWNVIYQRRYLDHDELARDALRVLVFYFKRGYRDARVDTSILRAAPGEVRVTLNVTEGPPTVVLQSSITDSANALSPREESRNLRPVAGEPLNLIALDSTAVRLKSILWQQGYADAVVTGSNRVEDSANTATVNVFVDPKRKSTIGEIVIQGNSKVHAQSIRNSLLISPGDLFRRSTVGRSQRALYEAGLFKQAFIDTLPGRDTVKTVVVRVQEGTLREARISGGFTTADFVQAEGRYTDNYWLGGARRLDIGVTFGNILAQQLSKSSFFADIANIVADNNLGRFLRTDISGKHRSSAAMVPIAEKHGWSGHLYTPAQFGRGFRRSWLRSQRDIYARCCRAGAPQSDLSIRSGARRSRRRLFLCELRRLRQFDDRRTQRTTEALANLHNVFAGPDGRPLLANARCIGTCGARTCIRLYCIRLPLQSRLCRSSCIQTDSFPQLCGGGQGESWMGRSTQQHRRCSWGTRQLEC